MLGVAVQYFLLVAIVDASSNRLCIGLDLIDFVFFVCIVRSSSQVSWCLAVS